MCACTGVCALSVHGGVHTGVSRQRVCVCAVSVGLWVCVHVSGVCVQCAHRCARGMRGGVCVCTRASGACVRVCL